MGNPDLGIIEGYYGRPWSWDDRQAVSAFLATHGYRFHHYAPKADPHVREDWTTPWPNAQRQRLEAFRDHCHANDLRFGVGLSPVGLQSDPDEKGLTALERRLREFNDLGVDDLVLLFDDQPGVDIAALAARQADIVHRAAGITTAQRIFFCPTYYSEDPRLDHVFGPRPADYLVDLGNLLDRSIRVYWAGEEICPAEITLGELRPVTEQLRRRPVLWDNYPVNDGPVTGLHLHLRGFTGRSSSLANALLGHAINPALQPWLSCIPALTLPASYREHAGYRYAHAQRQAAETVLGPELGAMVMEDLPLLEDRGRDRLSTGERTELTRRYSAVDHPAAREIIGWLSGEETGTSAPL